MLKLISSLIFFLYLHSSHACNSSVGIRHINSDGSIGGFVNATATVSAGAYVSREAMVCDYAVVESNTRLLDRSIVKENSVVKSGAVVKDVMCNESLS